MRSRETFLNGCIAGYNRDISAAAFRRHLQEYRTIEGKTELWEDRTRSEKG